MCHPNLELHGKKSVKKEESSQDERPNEAEYFFLMNEDTLH